jgi:hypothetical protein
MALIALLNQNQTQSEINEHLLKFILLCAGDELTLLTDINTNNKNTFLTNALLTDTGTLSIAYLTRKLMYTYDFNANNNESFIISKILCKLYKTPFVLKETVDNQETVDNKKTIDNQKMVRENILKLFFMIFPNNLKRLDGIIYNQTANQPTNTLTELNTPENNKMDQKNIQFLFSFNNISTWITESDVDLTPFLWKMYEFIIFPKVEEEFNKLRQIISTNNIQLSTEANEAFNYSLSIVNKNVTGGKKAIRKTKKHQNRVKKTKKHN